MMEGEDTRSLWLSCCGSLHSHSFCAINRLRLGSQAQPSPGAWLIVRPDVFRPESWLPWGKLAAWRERGIRDSVCYRFHLLSIAQDGAEVLMSEILISAEKGGEFFIDPDRQMRQAPTPIPSPQSSGDFSALSPNAGGFVMSCRVQGEGKICKPLVQLAMRYVTCGGYCHLHGTCGCR